MGKIKNPSRWMSKGFSIIEVISAIIILSIMATLSVNLMSDYKLRQNLTSARQQIMNAMTSAMAAAQRDNVTYVVTYKNYKVRACQAGKCGSMSDADAAFSHDLVAFSRPELFVGSVDGAGSLNLGDNVSGSDKFIAFTPFGKIQVSASLLGDIEHSGDYFGFFLRDEKGLLSHDDLCIGVKFTGSGVIDSVENGKQGGSCSIAQ